MLLSSDLFDIEGVTVQRESQCANCPDGQSNYSAKESEVIRPKLRAHRCHATPNALCGGPLRPRPLMRRVDRKQAILFLVYLGVREKAAREMVFGVRRMPMDGFCVILGATLAARKRVKTNGDRGGSEL